MVNGIGSVGFTHTAGVAHQKPAKMVTSGIALPAADEAGASEGAQSPAAALAALGAPVDADKVSSIRAGLADGSYKLDPQATARAMIAQDLSIGA